MNPLYMVELRIDIPALLRFIHQQGHDTGRNDEDLGYGVHAWLSAAFGQQTIRPWRLLHDNRRPPRILGYTREDAQALRRRLHEFAEPSVYAVCPDPGERIATRKMPRWDSGRRLGFEVQCCPVGRKAGSGIEKDIFLIRADATEGKETLNREAVYCDWIRERLERNNACSVTKAGLAGFRLVRQSRQTQKNRSLREKRRLIRPLALIRGELVINNPESFEALLSHGIGRHLAFGYGMLLLRPAS